MRLEFHDRLMDAIRGDDVFRVVIRGFGVFEDLLEARLAEAFEVPLEGLEQAPFRRKLNLAVALGLISPEKEAGLRRLATLRHQLAHADREPESVSTNELEEIWAALDDQKWLAKSRPKDPSPAAIARLAVIAAEVVLELGVEVNAQIRNTERGALAALLRSPDPPPDLRRWLQELGAKSPRLSAWS
jgi:hypothetical protein